MISAFGPLELGALTLRAGGGLQIGDALQGAVGQARQLAQAAPLGVLVSGSVQVHHPPQPTTAIHGTRDLRDEALIDRDRHTNDGWGFATFRSEDDARRAAAEWHAAGRRARRERRAAAVRRDGGG